MKSLNKNSACFLGLLLIALLPVPAHGQIKTDEPLMFMNGTISGAVNGTPVNLVVRIELNLNTGEETAIISNMSPEMGAILRQVTAMVTIGGPTGGRVIRPLEQNVFHLSRGSFVNRATCFWPDTGDTLELVHTVTFDGIDTMNFTATINGTVPIIGIDDEVVYSDFEELLEPSNPQPEGAEQSIISGVGYQGEFGGSGFRSYTVGGTQETNNQRVGPSSVHCANNPCTTGCLCRAGKGSLTEFLGTSLPRPIVRSASDITSTYDLPSQTMHVHLFNELSLAPVLVDGSESGNESVSDATVPWLVRASAGWNSVSGPTEVLAEGDDRVSVGATDEIAYGVEIERRLTPRLGVELGMLYSRPRFEAIIDLAPREDETGFHEGRQVRVASEAAFRPITVGLDIHLTPERRVDLTLTPLAGYAFYDDLSFSLEGEQTTLTVDDDFVWGVRLAADIPLGESRWGVSLGARYLDASMDGTDPDGNSFAIGLDPVVLTAGVSLRFGAPATGFRKDVVDFMKFQPGTARTFPKSSDTRIRVDGSDGFIGNTGSGNLCTVIKCTDGRTTALERGRNWFYCGPQSCFGHDEYSPTMLETIQTATDFCKNSPILWDLSPSYTFADGVTLDLVDMRNSPLPWWAPLGYDPLTHEGVVNSYIVGEIYNYPSEVHPLDPAFPSNVTPPNPCQ